MGVLCLFYPFPASLFWAFFLFHKFSNMTPPPPGSPRLVRSVSSLRLLPPRRTLLPSRSRRRFLFTRLGEERVFFLFFFCCYFVVFLLFFCFITSYPLPPRPPTPASPTWLPSARLSWPPPAWTETSLCSTMSRTR